MAFTEKRSYVTHSVCWSLLVVLSVILNLTGGALTAPVPVPDLSNCMLATPDPTNPARVQCCIPNADHYVDFAPPPYPSIRVRTAAHLASATYMEKYEKALNLMKALNASDPWSFPQQANIHCAYCNGAYKQTGYNVEVQVHNSWLFFPFHRAQLYFFERILGKLINDDTFALPFWNWDGDSEGMKIPSPYIKKSSPLFDDLRDPAHQPPKLCDLSYDGENETSPGTNITYENHVTMYRQMVSTAPTATAFLGKPYYGGESPTEIRSAGALELSPHGNLHDWVGHRGHPFRENMGNFYSAGRDPLFYAHHANVDRMWEIWKTLPGENRKNFNSTDWLNSAFLFWDENKQLVRIKVSDVLDTKKLGYEYQKLSLPWIDAKPIKAVVRALPLPTIGLRFPIRLDKPVSVLVDRRRVSRSKEKKAKVEEFIVIFGIKVGNEDYANFDVYVNAGANDNITTASAQFAGSFVNVPMGAKDILSQAVGEAQINAAAEKAAKVLTTSMTLGITDLLDELGVDGDKSIIVTLVPGLDVDGQRKASVIIGGIKIDFSSS